ncbi:hypothetical protein D9M70_498610 [compost metagenome]
MGKDARHVFRGNAFTVILDADLQCRVVDDFDPEGHLPRAVAEIGHGVFGVADQVDQDQQQAVFVTHDLRHLAVLLDHLDVMPGQRTGVHAQGVLEQFADVQRLHQIVGARVGLLGGDDVLDVVDAFAQLHEFVGHALLFERDGLHQLIEVTGKQFAFLVPGQEGTEVIRVFVDQLHGLAQPLGLAGAQFAADQIGRNVDAVEHVADVVQHIGGDLGHAGLTRSVEQFALGILELAGAFFHAQFQFVIGGFQGLVDAIDGGETAHQVNRQVHQQQDQQH